MLQKRIKPLTWLAVVLVIVSGKCLNTAVDLQQQITEMNVQVTRLQGQVTDIQTPQPTLLLFYTQ